MNYPVQLLPQQKYKQITADLTGYLLCRKVPDKSLLDELYSPILPEELLGIETPNDCFDYSTNLPGIFELHHNEIEFTGDERKYFRTYWDWASEVKIPVYEQDYFINENIGWFLLPINEIHGQTIPFSRKGGEQPNELAMAIALHTPSNSNFWHFSIRWKDANGYISTKDSKWKNQIIATIRALLSELIQLDYSGQNIPENYYQKES
jgi:hypothetical protein